MDRQTVVLLGATGSGKTTLVAAMGLALDTGGHGWPAAARFHLSGRIERTDRPDGPAAPSLSADYFDLVARAKAGGLPSHALSGPDLAKAFTVYRLLVERGGAMAGPPLPVDLVDTPGDLVDRAALMRIGRLLALPDASRTDADRGLLETFGTVVDHLLRCDAIILTVPFTGRDDRGLAVGLTALFDHLRGQGRLSCRRLIVAWTFYDRLVEPYGPRALLLAADAHYALCAMEQGLRAAPAVVEALLHATAAMPSPAGEAPAVFHVPVGTAGFDAGSGRAVATLGADRRLPFLAADPLLLALLADPGSTLHSRRQARIDVDDIDDEVPPAATSEATGFWRRMAGWLPG